MHEDLSNKLRTAFNARDIDAVRSLIAEDATWGVDPNSELACYNRNDIIRRLKQLLDSGVQATILETATGPRGIAARLGVDWPKSAAGEPNHRIYSQVYIVADGLVTEIHGVDDFDAARAALSD